MEKTFKIDSDFSEYKNYFLEENSKLNLISKNDEKFLYEKHIYDSLSIKLFFKKYNIKNANILDIGCGGGFPCLPIAIEFPQMKITGIDSIAKKINSVQNISNKLNLNNIKLITGRAEQLQNHKYDIVVSRAVADMKKISEYALPLLKKGGFFIAYKSRKINDELDQAKDILKKYNSKVIEIIEYKLPLEEIYERYLVCIKKL